MLTELKPLLLDGEATTATGGSWTIIVVYAAFFLILYFVLIRPQKKRQKETEKMQSSVENGDWVLLNNGMYGKVVNTINEYVIVEFGVNKSIMIPVLKNQIAAKQEPDLMPRTEENKKTEEEVKKVEEPAVNDGLTTYERNLLAESDKKTKKGFFGKKRNDEEL